MMVPCPMWKYGLGDKKFKKKKLLNPERAHGVM
jgi:hypothetical protein